MHKLKTTFTVHLLWSNCFETRHSHSYSLSSELAEFVGRPPWRCASGWAGRRASHPASGTSCWCCCRSPSARSRAACTASPSTSPGRRSCAIASAPTSATRTQTLGSTDNYRRVRACKIYLFTYQINSELKTFVHCASSLTKNAGRQTARLWTCIENAQRKHALNQLNS